MNESEEMWKEAGKAQLKYCLGICLSDSRKQTKNLNQCQRRCPDRDSNRELYHTEMLPPEPATGKENVKLFLCLIKHHAKMTYGGMEI
jgi:hypothetical protein